MSNEWVSKDLPTAGNVRHGALIGRVSLDRTDVLAGREFYIGPRHIERDGITVYSWAADVAATFFDPDGNAHELAQFVNARRTFAVKDGHVMDFEDNFHAPGVRAATAFPLVSALEIKKLPPGSIRSKATPSTASVSFPFRPSRATQPKATNKTSAPMTPPLPPLRLNVGAARQSQPRGLRAGKTLLRSLEAPRGDRLSSVLATLQADQFNSVRESADLIWVFEGGPGTGKTVIAIHRACYLVDEARAGNALFDVLLVGPTAGYQRHVSGVVAELNRNGRIQVKSVPALLTELAGLPKEPGGSFARDLYEVEWERLGECLVAADAVRRAGDKPTTQTVYDTIRTRGPELGLDGRCRSLPAFKDARTWLRYLPLLAASGLAAGQPQHRWAHVIVDEAQDIRPLEWAILERLRSPGASLSLFGDLSQRRHHAGYFTWQNMIDDLRRQDPGLIAKKRTMKRSYRSTAQILDYARKLLPKTQNFDKALRQNGPAVITDKAEDALRAVESAITHVERLASDYTGGTTAIITTKVNMVNAALRKRGHTIVDWRSFEWRTPTGGRLYLLNPTSARGLEFDAVVVLEPNDIPHSVFDGTLYTTLTRANKELRVVYSKQLPDELRRG